MKDDPAEDSPIAPLPPHLEQLVRDGDYSIVSTRPEDTLQEWQQILLLCANDIYVGFGALDSFLSGPDLDRRVELVIAEARNNATLRLELRDTLTMPQSECSAQQLDRLHSAARATAP